MKEKSLEELRETFYFQNENGVLKPFTEICGVYAFEGQKEKGNLGDLMFIPANTKIDPKSPLFNRKKLSRNTYVNMFWETEIYRDPQSELKDMKYIVTSCSGDLSLELGLPKYTSLKCIGYNKEEDFLFIYPFVCIFFKDGSKKYVIFDDKVEALTFQRKLMVTLREKMLNSSN